MSAKLIAFCVWEGHECSLGVFDLSEFLAGLHEAVFYSEVFIVAE